MRNRLLLLAEVMALLVLLEAGLRLAVPTQVDVPHVRVSPHGFYTWYPGSRFTFHNLPKVEPASAEVRINEHGLRGAPVARTKPPGERRILVLGDSYTAAVQLPEDVIYTTRLERTLNDGAHPGVHYRVVNAGFNGAGTAHELLYFLYDGRDLAPDLVVLQYSFNDVADTLAHGGLRWIDGRLELTREIVQPALWRGPLLALRDAIGNRSLAFFLLYKAANDVAARVGVRRAHAETSASATDADVAVVRAAIERLISSANASGIPVLVLTIPSPLYLSGGDATYDQVIAAVKAMTDGTTNELLVADPLLLDSERAARPVYLAFDGHLSEAGHALIAAALAPIVLQTTQASRSAVTAGAAERP